MQCGRGGGGGGGGVAVRGLETDATALAEEILEDVGFFGCLDKPASKSACMQSDLWHFV
jgi:hypothetical protein